MIMIMMIMQKLITDFIKTSEQELQQEENVKWLYNNNNPESEVKSKWLSTVDIRNPPGKSAENYLLLYKGLQASYGHILVHNYKFLIAKNIKLIKLELNDQMFLL